MAKVSIPGYTIERELGSGGMAKVYLAVQHSLERKVALKVMSPILAADESFTKRFLREARTIAGLTHPNIVAIYEVGVTVDNLHFFAMQHLPGGDFGSRMREGVDQPELCRVLDGIAKALGFAHERGFVHRDVSPANIIFDSSGNPVLTDFGIARALSGSTRITNTGVSIGTSLYMSPEQARGGDVDARSDLYSLGVLAFEALTGSTPYRGSDSFAVAYAHVFEPIPRLPPSCANWQSLIDKALAKDPRERFANDEEWCVALRKTLDAKAVSDTQPLKTVRSDAAAEPASEERGIVRPPAVTQLVAAMGERLKRARVSNATLMLRWTVPLLALLAIIGLGYGAYSQWAGSEEPPGPLASSGDPLQPTRLVDPPARPTPRDDQVGQDGSEGVGPTSDYSELSEEQWAEGTVDPTEPQGPPASEAVLAGWLDAGETAIRETRLMSPPGSSAVDFFDWVRELEPANERAVGGFESVITSYLSLAADAHGENDFETTRSMLDRARAVAERHPEREVQLQRINELPDGWLSDLLSQAERALAAWNPEGAASVLAEAAQIVPDDPRITNLLAQARALLQPGFRFADALSSGGSGPQMVVVGGGSVRLSGAGGGKSASIARPFAVGIYEVTLGQFKGYVQKTGQNPGGSCRTKESTGLFGAVKGSRNWRKTDFSQTDREPVVCVNFDSAQNYVRWLSRETGHAYRLLSEAEWQSLAAKVPGGPPCSVANVADKTAGGRRSYSCSDGHANTAPVGSFVALPSGPYDIDGNVREWVEDCANDSHAGHSGTQAARLSGDCSERLAMGRAWHSDKEESGVIQRKAFETSVLSNTIGIRVAMTLPDRPSGQ